MARQAAAAGVEPGRVFALAHPVVCAWWEQALGWEQDQPMTRTTAHASATAAGSAKPDGQTARTGRQTTADLAFLARAM
ncbi:hypothetical protein ACFXJ5_36285 [Streptomyces sp. NPDC059373]